MAKILKFAKKERPDPVSYKLVGIANEIDAIVLRNLHDPSVNPKELASVLAHRLGALLNHIDEKSELWEFCELVMKRQAHIE